MIKDHIENNTKNGRYEILSKSKMAIDPDAITPLCALCH